MALNITRQTYEDAYDTFKKRLRQVADAVVAFKVKIAGPVQTEDLWKVVDTINKVIPDVQAIMGISGFNAYVKAQTTSDIPVDFPAAQTAIINLRNAITALIPVNGSGLTLCHTLQANGSRVSRNFAAAETSGLLALCDAVTASLA